MLDTLTTDKNGHAESKELPICTYNEDGSFKEDIHYTVVETKAADRYILDDTAHDVTFRYDDNAPDVVVTTFKLVNVPTEPKLPQTGDNANPLLYLGIGALAFAIALELSIDEAKDLLNSAGFAFSRSSKTDIIVAYFLQNKIYDMFEIMNYCSLYSIYVSTNNERGKKIVYM